MSKALEYIKAAPIIGSGLFVVVVLGLVLWHLGDLSSAVGTILKRVPEGQISIKSLGVEASLDLTGVNQALSQADQEREQYNIEKFTADQKRDVFKKIRALTAKEVERLMQVGMLRDLCEYANPKPDMRMDVAIDYELEKKGFTNINPSPDTLEWVKGGQAEAIAKGKSVDIGPPLTCYAMTLTPAGYNVKTVLVKNLSAAFERTENPP
jgi:hypothetical protein